MSRRSREAEPKRSSYLDLVSDLTSRYPILQYLNFFISAPHPYPVRAAVLEFHPESVKRIPFEGPNAYKELQGYLISSSPDTPQHRLYLIEDLNPEFIELLGSYLNIDGTVFASQIRDAHYSGGAWNGHVPKLPSFQDPNQSFTLRYYESRYFKIRSLSKYGMGLVTASNVKRQFTFGVGAYYFGNDEGDGLQGHVGQVRRNTSFWSRKESNGSWNGVMLLDPAIGDSIIFCEQQVDEYGQQKEHTDLIAAKSSPYQRGYRDFTPWPSFSSFPLTPEQIRGPLRMSLLDDICHFWQHVASPYQITSSIASPFQSAQFQLHIVSSIWTNTLEHIHALLSELETTLREIERMISPNLSDKDKEQYMSEFSLALNEVNTLRRRLCWYVSEFETNLFALGISPLSTIPSRSDSQAEESSSGHEQNFLAMYNKLLTFQRWSETLLSVITTHVNLMETEKSITDSKSLSRLTILGFVFVPVSFVCSFFSMGGDFAVGQNRFWIYFVVVVPLTLLILGLGFWKWWLRRFSQVAERRGWIWPYRAGILRVDGTT